MKVNDFFCGAGGMGLGFHQAGFEVAGAWDYDKYAVESYRHNLSNNVKQGDIRDLSHEDVPEANVWTFGFPCFVPGTLVLTESGYRKIEDIKAGDTVLTHMNRYKKVVVPMATEADHIYRVTSTVSEDVLATEEHPFYARKKHGWFDEDSGKDKRRYDKPQWKKVKDLDESYYLGVATNSLSEYPDIDNRMCPSLYGLSKNDDFWWLIGKFLGKGYIEKPSNDEKSFIVMECDKEKVSEFRTVLESLKFEHLFMEADDKFRFHIYNNDLVAYLSSFRNSLDQDILNLPKSELQSFLYGLIESRGRINRLNLHTIVLKDKAMAYEVAHCIVKAFKVPFLLSYKQKRYHISFKLSNHVLEESFYEDGYLWTPIKSVKREEYHGLVYNFEVEEDNSYVVQNIIVHNCQDISVAGKRQGMIKGETRSGMFYEIMRLLEETENSGNPLPDIIMAENVKMVKNLLPEIEQEYNARGYNMYYRLLNSKYWGVAQSRERYFIVGVHKKYISPFLFPYEQTDFVPPLSQFLQSDVDEKFFIDNEKAQKVIEEARKRVDITGIHPCITPDREKKRQQGRRAKGNEEEMYTLTAQDIHGIIIDDTYGYDGVRVYEDVCPTLRASRSGLKTIDVLGRLEIKGQDNIRRVYNPEGVAPTLTTSEGGNRQPKVLLFENLGTMKSVVRKLTPREYARLQGFPDDYEQIVSNSQFYKQMGNAVTVNVARALAERIENYIWEENR